MSKSLPLTVVAGALALAAVPAISTAVARPAPAQALPDILDTAIAAGNFNTLVTAVQAAGLEDALKGPGPLTVFAPTDAAFAKLPPSTVQFLLDPQNVGVLTDILTYHVVADGLLSPDVLARPALDTLNGQRIDVSLQGGLPFVDQSQIIAPDILASNGVIHAIDTVMLPSFTTILRTADAAGSFSTLLTAIQAADLGAALEAPGPFTVFAPTDAAFAKLPPGTLANLLQPQNKQQLIDILTFHVVPGRVFANQAAVAGQATTLSGDALSFTLQKRTLSIGSAQVTTRDIDTVNGVVHVIDEVLIPPTDG